VSERGRPSGDFGKRPRDQLRQNDLIALIAVPPLLLLRYRASASVEGVVLLYFSAMEGTSDSVR